MGILSIAWSADRSVDLWPDIGSALYFRDRGFVVDPIGIRIRASTCVVGIIRIPPTRPL